MLTMSIVARTGSEQRRVFGQGLRRAARAHEVVAVPRGVRVRDGVARAARRRLRALAGLAQGEER